MAKKEINLKASKRLSPSPVRAFFKRCEWYDWFTLRDVEHYLREALYVATAWHGQKLVGLTALTGDGHNDVFLDTLVVDRNYQREGVGTSLMEMVLDKAERIKPYHFQIQVFDKQNERFYRRFGFVRNEATWLLEHATTADEFRARIKRIRKRKNK